MNLRPLSVALVLAGLLSSGLASAQISEADRMTARGLGQEGHAALDQRNFAAAVDFFTRADMLVHAPTFLLGIAQAQVGLGLLGSAHDTYGRILREGLSPNPPAAFVKALETARRELEALKPRLPYVIILVTGARPAKLTLDGEEVSLAAVGAKYAVNPGKHVLRAVVEGFLPVEATVTSVERKTEKVTLATDAALPVPPPEAPRAAAPVVEEAPGSLRRTLGFAGLGAGGAGLVVGAVLGGLVISKHGTLAKSCPGGHCPPAEEGTLGPQIASYHALSAGATAGFVIGGVLAAAGAVVLITAPRPTTTAGRAPWMTVSPVLGPAYAGAQGRF